MAEQRYYAKHSDTATAQQSFDLACACERDRIVNELGAKYSPALYADDWRSSDPDEAPHWDSLRDQVADYLRGRCVFTEFTHPEDRAMFGGEWKFPRFVLIRVGDGQTAEDLDLPERATISIEDGDEWSDRTMLPAIFTRGGATFVEIEID